MSIFVVMCTKVKSNIEYVEIIKKVLFKIFFECVVEVHKKYFLSIFVVMYSKYFFSYKNNFSVSPISCYEPIHLDKQYY